MFLEDHYPGLDGDVDGGYYPSGTVQEVRVHTLESGSFVYATNFFFNTLDGRKCFKRITGPRVDYPDFWKCGTKDVTSGRGL